MKTGMKNLLLVATAVTALMSGSVLAQEIPRTPDGKPDLNGIWQTMGTAHWNLETQASKPGPASAVSMGALAAIPGGQGVVVGGTIPYRPEALAKKLENQANWLELDPVVKCYLPGVPRATYLPYPFQIFQAPDTTLISYQFAGADRMIYMDQPDYESQVDSWMGHNIGHWEGDTLVVTVTGQMPDSWLDSAGNWHSYQMRVEERYTMESENVIWYEATITDPEVYTEPWTIRLPLYRRLDEGMKMLEFKCVEFVEELLYGQYRKPAVE
ncbi:MAG: hypothetical protein A3H44_02985 [Gammaproteobacteria bacterium RIFCSPLOWO2_02_FULL_57_10]|nr:MAG: hypothetical protein A3H44_02985 [Gammaproteobacteria bacterium RIFCSPLOWO2_02_FULL_57_10]